MGAQRLTNEELHTLLYQVECYVNSRPLLPLNSHPDDSVEVLTPGNFLVGRHLQALPEPVHTSTKLPLLKRWSLCQALSQHFWKRWSQEYLQQLQRITKWRTPSRNIQPGDVAPGIYPLADGTNRYYFSGKRWTYPGGHSTDTIWRLQATSG